MKHDKSRRVAPGVVLSGLNGNGGHEVQGVAIPLGAGHGRPARMREGQHPVPPAGSKRVYKKLMMKKKINYILENWKMIVHLLFKTRRFGVNNLQWSNHPSIFGSPLGLTRILKNYRMMKIRAFSGFIPLNDAIEIFPQHAKKHGYRPISKPESKSGRNEQ